jgi:hypothetical protein
MTNAHHKFDISLIPRVLSDPAPSDDLPDVSTGPKGDRSETVWVPKDRVLLLFREEAPRPLHVVDVARRVGVNFDDALRVVLRLVARGMLDLLERDPVANDHLVALSPRGEAYLREEVS